ncbi:hypothetical protein PC110_g8538 [Phytophthora cactorum]|uniref:Uncharacterized protein n=2 Tax=Phytophthora cactorum TaxID=29920 RepID=A0A329SGA4_9STRA|nr:hypothetical protein PC114_g1725 [Phytophthora cactorum]KAG3024239.1 hypothetical protein PC119_g8608 [Phytophthora cactorum]KAG3089015.1 hypothetical protein PC122_g8113 [Phytophthora cactorum]RAW35126.1 hypothetical protein PC110_g8538 [Phytophthora cactorum]
MTRTNKTRRNPPGSLPDDAATGPGVKDDGSGEDSEVEATQVSVEAKTSALKQSKDLVNESVMAMLDAFGQTNTETKQKASFVADRIGLPISSQQVRILLKSRLGHGNVEQRLKVVLAEFVTDAGNACVLLQGEWDQTTDIVLQTKVQREIFSRATHLDLTGHIPARTSNSMSTLLCQFHVHRYVKRMKNGKQYFAAPSYRDEIESMFKHMLYVPTMENDNQIATARVSTLIQTMSFLPLTLLQRWAASTSSSCEVYSNTTLSSRSWMNIVNVASGLSETGVQLETWSTLFVTRSLLNPWNWQQKLRNFSLKFRYYVHFQRHLDQQGAD